MPVLVASVLMMSATQLLDLGTFAEMVRRLGPHAEANPLVATLFALYGLPMVAIAKVALIALLTAIVAVVATKPRGRLIAGTVLGIAIVAGIVGGASNTAAIGLL